jgi:hypothetical protein
MSIRVKELENSKSQIEEIGPVAVFLTTGINAITAHTDLNSQNVLRDQVLS